MVKLGWRSDLTQADGVDLVLDALFQAADEDSATGGPDLLRGIYPIVATITERGFERVDEAELAERTQVLVERLRAQRGSPAAHDNH